MYFTFMKRDLIIIACCVDTTLYSFLTTLNSYPTYLNCSNHIPSLPPLSLLPLSHIHIHTQPQNQNKTTPPSIKQTYPTPQYTHSKIQFHYQIHSLLSSILIMPSKIVKSNLVLNLPFPSSSVVLSLFSIHFRYTKGVIRPFSYRVAQLALFESRQQIYVELAMIWSRFVQKILKSHLAAPLRPALENLARKLNRDSMALLEKTITYQTQNNSIPVYDSFRQL